MSNKPPGFVAPGAKDLANQLGKMSRKPPGYVSAGGGGSRRDAEGKPESQRRSKRASKVAPKLKGPGVEY